MGRGLHTLAERYLHTSDLRFEIQTLQLAFQTSKFGLQTCSLHNKFLCTQAQTIFFRTILIVKTALGAMFDIGWGSTKPLKGYPNYIIYPQGLAVIFSHHQ